MNPVALTQFAAVIAGAVILGCTYGAGVGQASFFFGYALMPFVQ